ncbi:hypothetical protein FB107DRAFT_178163, partial [Schizophyllum commune]
MPDSLTSSAGRRLLRHRLLPSWVVSYFARVRASPSAPIASSAIASSTTTSGDDADVPQRHPQPASSAAVAASPATSSSPGKRPGLREQLSISKLYRRLSRALASSSRGSTPIVVRSASPELVSDALQVPPPPSSSADGTPPDTLTSSLPPPRAVEACEITAPSADVSDALISTSSAVVDVAGAPANPMTTMWTEAVAEWQRKAGVDLNAPEATLFSSKEALASYVAKIEADSQGGTEMNRWGRLRNTLFPLARIVAKLCGPIGDTLSSTATVQAHEEFELITDAFNEIRVHLQVVEIV